jgi:hypothetical protein
VRAAILRIFGLGSWDIQLAEHPVGYIDTIHSAIYICPTCEDIWARIRVSGMWDAWSLGMPCERCPSTRRQRIPGSILRNVAYAGYPDLDEADIQLMRALPAELLAREFDLHIKALEQDYGPTVRNAAGENSSRSLAADPEFARYFQSNTTWHLPERVRSTIPTYDNRDPDIFSVLSAAVAANLAAGGTEPPAGSECDADGTDGHGQDPHNRDPG